MIKEPKQEDIDKAFEGKHFGPRGETPEGRALLVADCLIKNACGYRSGSTIEAICIELGLMTKKYNPTLSAKKWAYSHLIYNHTFR